MLDDLWYKNAVIYCLDVGTFQDGNGDGIGDFAGLKRRLGYLEGLGVTCLWLLPFFPSPNLDNGYDVSDFYGVDPRHGDLGDFVSFAREANAHGIRLIIDLVANHTSDQHPWFQAARADPESPFRDYYVWSKQRPKDLHEGMVFPGVQRATWTRDAKAGAWYFHRFHHFQPDLNIANPHVREELFKVMGYWLQLGVSGFRVDAVPFLLELKGVKDHSVEDPHALLDEMREFLSWRRGDAVLLAEANVPMQDVTKYFGGGKRMQLVFNFPANQHLFAGLVNEDGRGLAKVLRSSPKLPASAQWANFLRNHDELDLGRLDEELREQVFAALGPDPKMQLYGRGLRRRLAPMLDGDPRRMRLVWSLMFALPGTPVLWYGEEIGMGERLAEKGRQAVRTPMQWSNEPYGGFSYVKPLRSLVDDGPFEYRRVNVGAQRNDPDSLLNWLERIIRLRKECPEIGWGEWTVLQTGNKAVLALRYDWRGNSLVTVHNLSPAPLTVKLRSGDEPKQVMPLVDLLTSEECLPEEDGRHRLTLEGHGYQWYRLGSRDSALWRDDVPEV